MLRASSVGLGLHSTTSRTGQICRRIYMPWQRLPYCFAAALSSDPTGRVYPLYPSHKQNPDIESEGNFRSGVAPTKTTVGHTSATRTFDLSSGVPSVPFQELREFMLHEDIQVLGSRKGHPTAQGTVKARNSSQTKEIKHIFYGKLDRVLERIMDDLHKEANATPLAESVQEGVVYPKSPFLLLHVSLREHLLSLAQTQDANVAWLAYTALVDCITRIPAVHRHLPHIPFPHLHRLCRILASNRPKTHRQYLRLLAVMTYIKHCDGVLHQHEYNALIDHAGRGWRKTREEEMLHAKRVAEQVSQGILPGLTEEAYDFQNEDYAGLNPDIYTYTTLLATAARASQTKEILNVASVMRRAGIPPNRITNLALLRYFTQQRNLGGVRSTLQKMRAQNLELGVDGLNACMWAYGKNNRVDIAFMVYRLLRNNVVPESYSGQGDIRETMAYLAEEYIFVEPEMRPDEITFTMLIQLMAYLGHFQAVLDIFQDMLTFEAPKRLSDGSSTIGPSESAYYSPTLSVFRNIFLGFSKYGTHSTQTQTLGYQDWNLDNLTNIFERFLHLPIHTKLSYANVDIIMKAFYVTSGGNQELIRDVWIGLEERFGPVQLRPNSSNRLSRLRDEVLSERLANLDLKPD